MPRNNILLKRPSAPKRVELPKGRFSTLVIKNSADVLSPTRVRQARTYVRKIGPRWQRIRRIGPRNQRRSRQQANRGYLYENLFFPEKGSKLHSCKRLTNVALEILLN